MSRQIKKGMRVQLRDGSPAQGIYGTVIDDGPFKTILWDAAIITVPEGYTSEYRPRDLQIVEDEADETK